MGQELEEIRRIRVGTVPPSPQCFAPARVFPRLTINRQPIIRRMPRYVIRTAFSESTVRVYQAYRAEIAMPALAAGRFVPPFSMGRMTWIKPSFNWMMYRCGYATKSGQEVVLGIDITREGFEWALEHAVLSSFNPSIHSSHDEWRSTLSEAPVRIQWDPERDWRLSVVGGVRAIQIGLTGEAVQRYMDNWIVRLEDVTPVAHRLDVDLKNGAIPDNLPDNLETPYPLIEPRIKNVIAFL
jgi:Domain of unknown function (DUF4291)